MAEKATIEFYEKEWRESEIKFIANIIESGDEENPDTKILTCKICKEQIVEGNPFMSAGTIIHFVKHARKLCRGSMIDRAIICAKNVVYRNQLSTRPFSWNHSYKKYGLFISYEFDSTYSNSSVSLKNVPKWLLHDAFAADINKIVITDSSCGSKLEQYYKYAIIDDIIVNYIREIMIDSEEENEILAINRNYKSAEISMMNVLDIVEEFIEKYAKIFCAFCRKQYISFPSRDFYYTHLVTCAVIN